MTSTVVVERPLSDVETVALAFIEKHPGLTAYDLAERFLGHSAVVYAAIYYLVSVGRADLNYYTSAITAREM